MDNLKRYAKILGEDRPEIRDILARAEMFPQNHEKYSRLLLGLYVQEGNDPADLPAFGKYMGEYPLPIDFYLRHKVQVATTGVGKSMQTYSDICNLIERGRKAIIFDPQNEYIDLGLKYPDRVMVAWPDVLRIGLLQPYGDESPEDTAIRLVTDVREPWFLRDMSENLFFEEIVACIEKYENPTPYHMIRNLASKLQNPRARRYGAVETILNRLTRAVTELPGTFGCSRGFPLEFFLENSIVFPLKGVSTYLGNLLINLVLHIIMKNKGPSETLDIVFVLEECQNYFSRQREARMDLGEIFVYSAMRMGRKLGLAFILLSQTMSTFSPAILANANTVFVGRLLNGA